VTVANGSRAASRPYRSALRAEQAARTRGAVLDAAGLLFVRDGYAATTMKGIAAAAGVSVESVYAQGSKASLLLACVDRSITGDDEEVPVAQRADFRAALTAGGRGMLEAYGRWVAERMPAVGPILAAFGRAAAADAELSAAWAEYDRRRREDIVRLVGAMAGDLRPGLTVERASDVMSAIVSPAVLDMLRSDRGWSDGEVAAWVVDSLERLLLA
jgi:AcrR family transcriptional regulator